MFTPIKSKLRHLKFVLCLASLHFLLRVVRAENLIKVLPQNGSLEAPKRFAHETFVSIRAASLSVRFATCLPQALLARLVLARQGYKAPIYIGVNTVDGNLVAHAWTMSGEFIVSGGPQEVVQTFKTIRVLD